MTLSDLIAAFRTEAADQAEPPLWSDAEIAGYLADAESEACIRARLLFDESSPAVAVIGIDTAAWVALDPSIIDVTRAHLASSPGRLLAQCPPEVLDRQWWGWETQTGPPTGYYVIGNRLRLIPQPTQASDTLYLSVYRTPLVPLTADDLDASPEIQDPHHLRLLDWALYRAYSKRDIDTADMTRANGYRLSFVEHFGPRPSASAIRKQAEKRAPVVRPIHF
jgi:hypothetical protein